MGASNKVRLFVWQTWNATCQAVEARLSKPVRAPITRWTWGARIGHLPCWPFEGSRTALIGSRGCCRYQGGWIEVSAATRMGSGGTKEDGQRDDVKR